MLLIAPNEKFYFKDSLRDCQASICIIRIGKLPSIVIVTTGKDMGKVTITAGRPVKQQELYITDGEAGGWMAQSHKRHWILWSQWSVFKHFNRLKKKPTTATCELCFCSYPVISFSRPAFSLPVSQAPVLTRSMSNYSWAGAWLPSAVFQFKVRFRGEIHQSRAGHLASVALRACISILKCNFYLRF